jgi:DNA-binding MarR family transcriptional regulator
MGRKKQTQPPVEPEFIRQCFAIRQDGQLIWRERPGSHFPQRTDDVSRFNAMRSGEPAGFPGPNGVMLVRFQFHGQTRRIAASRVAWCVAVGAWPSGPVKARNGIDGDLRFENLIVTKHGRDPFGQITGKHSNGGKASSLDHRAKATTTLINALAANPGSTVPVLSKLTGSSVSCCCTRLGKLADAGLTCGPKCDARARWELTPKGRELGATSVPVILDDLDKRILAIISRSTPKLMELARQTEVCRLTMRRRINRLVERKLVEDVGVKRGFSITDEGRKALGPDTPQLRNKLPDSHDLAEVDPSELPVEALANFEDMLIEAATAEAQNPSHDNLPADGSLIERTRTDAATGEKHIDWYGRQSFIKSLTRHGRPVERIVDRKATKLSRVGLFDRTRIARCPTRATITRSKSCS